MKKAIKELDQKWLLGKCKDKAPWRLWDEVLNLGERQCVFCRLSVAN